MGAQKTEWLRHLMLPEGRLGGGNIWVQAAGLSGSLPDGEEGKGVGLTMHGKAWWVKAGRGTPGCRTITITITTCHHHLPLKYYSFTRDIGCHWSVWFFFSIWFLFFEESVISIMLSIPKMASPNKSPNSQASCRPDFYRLFAARRLMCVDGLEALNTFLWF